MGKTATNIAVVLGLITVAFAGYYMYTQKASTGLDFASNEQTMQAMLNNTHVFMEHRQTLDKVKLDIGFFEDERLLSLRSFSTPLEDHPIGRPNPFAAVSDI